MAPETTAEWIGDSTYRPFNEAGARWPRKPEGGRNPYASNFPSMRPGQDGPGNSRGRLQRPQRTPAFNEAGARWPRKHNPTNVVALKKEEPSMRPGQDGPGNSRYSWPWILTLPLLQ